MATHLTEYKKKRKLKETPEPGVQKKNIRGRNLAFVVQQHDASHLHYDFRLEWDGVLKSWAVPKGPSMNPADKRLAMHVEDHPYSYKDFEGTIPEGHYGAGEVIVWDRGNYMPEDGGETKKENEQLMEAGYRKGKLTFVLNGEKLKGLFTLVKTNRDDDRSWLLIKKHDEYAKETDITRKNKSVVSGKPIPKRKRTSAVATKRAPAKKTTARG